MNTNSTTTLKRIYVSADAFWDLRQGTLARINPEFAVGVTADPEYYIREEDMFTYKGQTLRRDIYDGVFKKYEDEILRCSLRTEILDFLHALSQRYFTQSVTDPFTKDFGIEVNTYPFILTDVEKDEVSRMLKSAFKHRFPISIVRLSPEALTLTYVRENYLSMVMYNYYTWMNAHTEALKKSPLMEVGLFAPRLYFLDKSKITSEAKQLLKKRGKDEFEYLSDLLQPFVGIQFLPISLFSAATPMNLPSLRQLVKNV